MQVWLIERKLGASPKTPPRPAHFEPACHVRPASVRKCVCGCGAVVSVSHQPRAFARVKYYLTLHGSHGTADRSRRLPELSSPSRCWRRLRDNRPSCGHITSVVHSFVLTHHASHHAQTDREGSGQAGQCPRLPRRFWSLLPGACVTQTSAAPLLLEETPPNVLRSRRGETSSRVISPRLRSLSRHVGVTHMECCCSIHHS